MGTRPMPLEGNPRRASKVLRTMLEGYRVNARRENHLGKSSGHIACIPSLAPRRGGLDATMRRLLQGSSRCRAGQHLTPSPTVREIPRIPHGVQSLRLLMCCETSSTTPDASMSDKTEA